jgi:ABC-type uncharacterized transport system permease subunit
MNNITFISTVHEEMGKCNADELCVILEQVSPEIVFLEALGNTYIDYERDLLLKSWVYHNKLEIEAIQKYNQSSTFEYVPVLDTELSASFEKKYELVFQNNQFKTMLDEYNALASEQGFLFLNSKRSIQLQDEMRQLEDLLVEDNLIKTFNEDIEAYENPMMRNIYSYCRNNQFDKAVFLCGVAHRRSIIEKMESFNRKEKTIINWVIYGDQSI